MTILYPTRKDLAIIYDQLRRTYYSLIVTSGHGVSEALYPDDPDGNGVELYWTGRRNCSPKKSDGLLDMFRTELDIENLLSELNLKIKVERRMSQQSRKANSNSYFSMERKRGGFRIIEIFSW